MKAFLGDYPATPLAVTRILLASAFTGKVAVLAPSLLAYANPAELHIELIDGLGYPSAGVIAGGLAVALSAGVSLLLGWRTRVAAATVFMACTLILVLDRQLYSNHLYLIAVLTGLLALSDSGAAWSLDARRRGGARASVPASPVYVLMAMAPILYGFAALSKINDHWLSGTVLRGSLRNGPLALPEVLRDPQITAAIALLTVAMEASLALGLLTARTRKLAVLLGIFTHLGMVVILDGPVELVVFGLAATSVYPLFLALNGRPQQVPDTTGNAAAEPAPPLRAM